MSPVAAALKTNLQVAYEQVRMSNLASLQTLTAFVALWQAW